VCCHIALDAVPEQLSRNENHPHHSSLAQFLVINRVSVCIHSSRKAGTLTPRVPVEEFDAYVDNKAAGEEKGTKDFPYHSITKALQKVTGRSIKVLAGKDYVEAIRITLNLNARITPAEPGLWAKK